MGFWDLFERDAIYYDKDLILTCSICGKSHNHGRDRWRWFDARGKWLIVKINKYNKVDHYFCRTHPDEEIDGFFNEIDAKNIVVIG